jgi:hypothetical protein
MTNNFFKLRVVEKIGLNMYKYLSQAGVLHTGRIPWIEITVPTTRGPSSYCTYGPGTPGRHPVHQMTVYLTKVSSRTRNNFGNHGFV